MMGGSQTELFRWPVAELYLVDGDERALMQRGLFTLFLASHFSTPHLVAVEATVGDVQWPVGKDCKVAYRHGQASEKAMHFFTFMLQNLMYELVLDEREGHGLNMPRMEKLQELLTLYTTFSLQASGNMAKTYFEEEAGKYWTGMAGRILASDTSIEGGDDKRGAALQLSLAGRHTQPQRGATAMMSTNDVGAGVRKRNIMKRIHQARRISAVAKLFSKAVMRGAISAELHTRMEGEEGGGGRGMAESKGPAVAEVDAVAKVVDVVERRATMREAVQEQRRILRGSWTLNEVGMQVLLNAVVAAYAIAASAGSPGGSSSGSPNARPAPH